MTHEAAEQLASYRKSIANDVGLSQHFVEGLMRMIVRAVVKRHKEIAASK